MHTQLGDLLQKIDNSVRAIANTEAAFVKLLSQVLTSGEEFIFQMVERTLQRLREKEFELYRSIIVNPQKLQNIVHICPRLDLLGLLMHDHQEYSQRSGYDYGQPLLQLLHNQILQLLRAHKNDEGRVLFTSAVEDFYNFKKMSTTNSKWTRMDVERKKQLDDKIYLVFEYVVNPILSFGQKFDKTVYQATLCKWLLLLAAPTNMKHNKLIYELSKRLLGMCSPLNQVQLPIVQVFTLLMNFCEVEYHSDELFSIDNNLGLFINFIHRDIVPELTRSWMRTLKNTKPLLYRNVCWNLLGSSITVNILRIIQTISMELKQGCNFQALEAIYQKAIKHRLVRCTFRKEQTFLIMLDIVTFYAAGFINLIRLDDQLQSIIGHYKTNLLYSGWKQLQTSSYKLVLLLIICDTFFKNLTNLSRSTLKNISKIFNKQPKDFIPLAYEYVTKNKFPIDFNAISSVNISQTYNMTTSQRYVGLTNIGNTCYINSYVQALYMTKSMRTLFEDIDPSDDTRPSSSLSALFLELSARQQDIRPYKFKRLLEQPFKSSTEQQDSAQFGRSLLQQLNRDLSNTHICDSLNEIFTTNFNNIMSCRSCGQGRSQKVFHKQIIVPLGSKNQPVYISQTLRGTFQPQDLSVTDLIDCQRCRTRRQFTMKNLPEVFSSCITVALNRFEFMMEANQPKFIKKFNPIHFEFNIKLSDCVPNLQNSPNSTYELHAFIVHIGTSPAGGHYITYARNIDENPNVWYTFDDSYVTEKNIETFDDFNLGEFDTPYLLFYSSQSGKPVVARKLDGISMKKPSKIMQ